MFGLRMLDSGPRFYPFRNAQRGYGGGQAPLENSQWGLLFQGLDPPRSNQGVFFGFCVFFAFVASWLLVAISFEQLVSISVTKRCNFRVKQRALTYFSPKMPQFPRKREILVARQDPQMPRRSTPKCYTLFQQRPSVRVIACFCVSSKLQPASTWHMFVFLGSHLR